MRFYMNNNNNNNDRILFIEGSLISVLPKGPLLYNTDSLTDYIRMASLIRMRQSDFLLREKGTFGEETFTYR